MHVSPTPCCFNRTFFSSLSFVPSTQRLEGRQLLLYLFVADLPTACCKARWRFGIFHARGRVRHEQISCCHSVNLVQQFAMKYTTPNPVAVYVFGYIIGQLITSESLKSCQFLRLSRNYLVQWSPPHDKCCTHIFCFCKIHSIAMQSTHSVFSGFFRSRFLTKILSSL